jgi:RNA polymerase sigma factor (sigma-70 family)
MSDLPPFEELLERHAGEVLGFLSATVGPVDADDCFQETFIAALRAYPGLKDGRNLRSWLFTIANRKAIDHFRAGGRRPTPTGDGTEAGEPAVPGPEPSGEIWHSVAALPEKQRTAVALRFACDLPHREIAAALGTSVAASRQSLREGLNTLRKEHA